MPEHPVQRRTIILRGRTITYRVRRSPRAQRITLRVIPAQGLEIVVPQHGRLPALADLLHERADWVLRTLDRVAAKAPTPTATLAAGATVPYRGDDYRLLIQAISGARPTVRRDAAAHILTAHHDPATHVLADVLAGWYRAEARATLAARAATFAATLGVTYTRLTIRDTRSRWGSCSTAGGLNFSWRLILAPPAVLDYVVLHELVHRREMNHSPRFWALVAASCPDFRQHRDWLKVQGGALMAFLSIPT